MSHGSTSESPVVRTPTRSPPRCHLPPALNTCSTFLQRFADLLTKAPLLKRPATLAGDFNIHVDDLNDANSMSFLDFLSALGL